MKTALIVMALALSGCVVLSRSELDRRIHSAKRSGRMEMLAVDIEEERLSREARLERDLKLCKDAKKQTHSFECAAKLAESNISLRDCRISLNTARDVTDFCFNNADFGKKK